MIRFSALLVAAATVLLIAGVVTSKLVLVYVAIGVSALALVALGAGAGLKRHELFGQTAESGRTAESGQMRQPVPSAPVPSAQPEAVSVAANGSAGAASASSPAVTKSAAPWESGAVGWGDEATAWASDAPPIREQASSAQKLDPFPASSAWPPAPPVPAAPVPANPAPAAPAASGWPAPPETARFDTGQPAPGLAAYAQPVNTPEYARPDDREAPAAEPASSASLWSTTVTPRSAPSDADGARLTTTIPARPAPEAIEPEAADLKAGAEPGESDAGRPADANAETSDGVADDTSASAADDAEAKAVSATPSRAAAAEAGDRPDGTMVLDASAMTAPAMDTGSEEPAHTNPAVSQDLDGAAGDAEAFADAGAAPDDALDASADGSPAAVSDSDAEPADAKPADAAVVDLAREVTTVPGVPRYHDAHCILIRFMGEDDLEKMTLAAATEAGCTPCRACLPDQEPA